METGAQSHRFWDSDGLQQKYSVFYFAHQIRGSGSTAVSSALVPFALYAARGFQRGAHTVWVSNGTARKTSCLLSKPGPSQDHHINVRHSAAWCLLAAIRTQPQSKARTAHCLLESEQHPVAQVTRALHVPHGLQAIKHTLLASTAWLEQQSGSF